MARSCAAPSLTLLVVAGIITPLFVSRAIYNFVAIGNAGLNLWGYRWTFLSDQVGRERVGGGSSCVSASQCVLLPASPTGSPFTPPPLRLTAGRTTAGALWPLSLRSSSGRLCPSSWS